MVYLSLPTHRPQKHKGNIKKRKNTLKILDLLISTHESFETTTKISRYQASGLSTETKRCTTAAARDQTMQ